MKKIDFLVLALGASLAAAAATPALAGLGEAGELEHARANARAGGPISERDAELLERYGCLSGTRNAFCRRLEHKSSYRPAPRLKRRYGY